MITLLRIGMSYCSPNRKEFLISSDADVANLPTSKKPGNGITGVCAYGSLAYTPDMAKMYMLGNDDTWYKCVRASGGGGGGGGTGVSNYNDLDGKPCINGNELVGDKTATQLGMENEITDEDIDQMFEA